MTMNYLFISKLKNIAWNVFELIDLASRVKFESDCRKFCLYIEKIKIINNIIYFVHNWMYIDTYTSQL